MPIAAQVSLYPLRQPRISPGIEKALGVFQRHGLEVSTGPMSTVVVGEEEAVFNALKEAVREGADDELERVITISNACPE